MGRKSWRTTIYFRSLTLIEGQVTNCPWTSTAKFLNHGTAYVITSVIPSNQYALKIQSFQLSCFYICVSPPDQSNPSLFASTLSR